MKRIIFLVVAYLFNHGVSAEQMPDHTDLSESQIENIVSYLDSESTNNYRTFTFRKKRANGSQTLQKQKEHNR